MGDVFSRLLLTLLSASVRHRYAACLRGGKECGGVGVGGGQERAVRESECCARGVRNAVVIRRGGLPHTHRAREKP